MVQLYKDQLCLYLLLIQKLPRVDSSTSVSQVQIQSATGVFHFLTPSLFYSSQPPTCLHEILPSPSAGSQTYALGLNNSYAFEYFSLILFPCRDSIHIFRIATDSFYL